MVFRKVWTVINLESSITESEIRGWLSAAQIPSCFQFVFGSPFESAWRLLDAYGGTVPAPFEPWTVLISSKADSRFNWTVYGISWLGANNCSVMFDPSNPDDTVADRGARVFHEMLHCMAGYAPPDAMKTTEFAEFSQYLVDTGSPHQDFITNPDSYDEMSPQHTALLIEYYAYLTHKYLSCGCYGTGCGGANGGFPWTNETILLTCAGIVAAYLLIG